MYKVDNWWCKNNINFEFIYFLFIWLLKTIEQWNVQSRLSLKLTSKHSFHGIATSIELNEVDQTTTINYLEHYILKPLHSLSQSLSTFGPHTNEASPSPVTFAPPNRIVHEPAQPFVSQDQTPSTYSVVGDDQL